MRMPLPDPVLKTLFTKRVPTHVDRLTWFTAEPNPSSIKPGKRGITAAQDTTSRSGCWKTQEAVKTFRGGAQASVDEISDSHAEKIAVRADAQAHRGRLPPVGARRPRLPAQPGMSRSRRHSASGHAEGRRTRRPLTKGCASVPRGIH